MLSSPIDNQPGSPDNKPGPAGGRYGPAGFAAAVVTIVLLEALACFLLFAPFMLPIILPPVLIIVALLSYGLTRAPGTPAQIGRGMLIGCLAPLLSVLIFVPAFIIARWAGAL